MVEQWLYTMGGVILAVLFILHPFIPKKYLDIIVFGALCQVFGGVITFLGMTHG